MLCDETLKNGMENPIKPVRLLLVTCDRTMRNHKLMKWLDTGQMKFNYPDTLTLQMCQAASIMNKSYF